MKTFSVAFASLLSALALAGAAAAGISFGVTEDAAKYSIDGGASVFSSLHDIGMSENAVSVQWDPTRPATIVEKRLLDHVVPTATAHGIRLIFTVYPTRAAAITSSAAAPIQFASFLQLLARTYPQVKDFVVGNEPNYGRFWQPQLAADGQRAAGAAYEALLARSYDALKAVSPAIDVIGMGLAAHGNGRTSTAPVLFIRDVGAAYRASGRQRPLMDALAYHPYPASSGQLQLRNQAWPNAGIQDLSRIKQAVWDAFDGTRQPTFEAGLRLKITEIGWQVRIPADELSAYQGRENVRTTNESTQADLYSEIVSEVSCDPAVTDLLFFHLVDEPNLAGFQSGLIRADGTRRPSYFAVKGEIAQLAGRCLGQPVQWHHATTVVGAQVQFEGGAGAQPTFRAQADEDAAYSVGLFSVNTDGSYKPVGVESTSGVRTTSAVRTTGEVQAGRKAAGSFPSVALAPGTYVEAVKLVAAMNPKRTSTFVSSPFTIAPPAAPASSAPAATTPAPTTPAATSAATATAPAATLSAETAPAPVPQLPAAASAQQVAPVTGGQLTPGGRQQVTVVLGAAARPRQAGQPKQILHATFSAKPHRIKLPPPSKPDRVSQAAAAPLQTAAPPPVPPVATSSSGGAGRSLAMLFGVPLALAGVALALRVALRHLW